MFFAIMSKPVKKVMGPEWNGCWELQHNNYLQQHPTFYTLNPLIFMTVYDIKCSSKLLIQVKSELWKLDMGCYKLAENSLRPANFTSPYFHERCWHSWWTHERLHLHVIICLNCSCPWKLFRQANRSRALSINQGTSQTAVIFDSQKLLTDTRALKNHKWMEGRK